ncbi:4Fe-4S dicluster domain-containing protein [Desulfobaculum bizertense]|uniref:4Fe-4S dicluster domain-containing protein n=1 Tax=Desulfobaculum bizertense TaxID=376490 RepID=UPI002545DE1E|nr:4Fe-4S dicluster domain-containing protein [Desulfobaculum bizertense]
MPEPKENSIIYADASKCVGCKQCELACAQAHSGCTLPEAKANSYRLISRIHIVRVDELNVPMLCRQCEDAPCAYACPTGAIYQENGIVQISENRCVGCKVCVMACPFGAIEVLHEGTTQKGRTNLGVIKKCNLCVHRIDDDGMFHCACVEACPTKALRLVSLTDHRKQLMIARAREASVSSMHKG